MRWLLYLLLFFLTIQQPCRGDLLKHITYNVDPIPGSVRLRYNGWRGIAVREIRRQLYNLWADSIELRTDGGLDGRRNHLLREMQLVRGEDDLLGFYWQRRWWELEPIPTTILEVGGAPRSVDFGFVKFNPDWQIKWKEWNGKIPNFDWSWKLSPQVSMGVNGMNSCGGSISLRRRSIEISLNSGWNKRRGFEVLIGIEIWRI